ncbi:MAG: type VI secretion system tip protein VgrG [Candidatus Saccharibacteria bacterium]|nr:type VI secretion system tip protein VgrG [Pseudorhodobacter sp.]
MKRIARQTENLFLTLTGAGATGLICAGARIRDKLSMIPEMRMEFFSEDSTFNPIDILGTTITLEAGNTFRFSGIVISVEELEGEDGGDLYSAEVRPWPWLMTIGSENRVFQDMSTIDIIREVFRVAGFTDLTDKTSDTYEPREYSVQYGESNFAFISRLMEEDGIYYFFDHSGKFEKIVLCDSISAHADGGMVKFVKGNRVGNKQATTDTVFEWTELGRVVTGKVALFDYDMNLPNADLKVQSVQASGSHAHNSVERYGAGGHYKVAENGEAQARKELEGLAAAYLRAKGAANSPVITTGAVFTLSHEERTAANGAYLVLGCTHYLVNEAENRNAAAKTFSRHVEHIEFPERMALFETEFEVQRQSIQYRPPKMTAWPEVPALLTAKVTGPSGEEIHTDDYGRIKVIFPWDRQGKADDTSSCWVRSVMPWGGKNWGMFSVPRIGMEVIIQFERGNIDRPYCTGVIYNGVNKPPYDLPADMTKTGIRTNSSKGGGGFHELTFEDKKDAESVFFQSEKDYKQIVKNNAEITIGMEKMDKGSLTQTIYQDKTETIKMGDLTQTVETGNRITKINTDDTTTIDGASTTKIEKDAKLTVSSGDLTQTVDQGKMTTTVAKDTTTTSQMGNITIEASGGKVTITAAMEIKLTVGGNSITIGPAGVTVSGTTITLDGKAMTEVKGPMVKVAGTGMLDMSGGLVKIN